MYLFISPQNGTIHTSEKIVIKAWNEYGNTIQMIPTTVSEMEVGKHVDELLLIPMTHIINLWHLMHHLYITFKYIKNKKHKYVYPIFFPGFFEHQGDIVNTTYIDLITTGMGFQLDNLIELHKLFKDDKPIETSICTIPYNSINFKNFQTELSEMAEFKLFVMNNFNIEYRKSDAQNITFILRRVCRQIANIEYVQTQFTNISIRYVYLEDFAVKEQLDIVANTDVLIGVHGAGLTWCLFMKPNSRLIEIFPGNSNSDNYIKWCKLANVKYKRIIGDIHKGNPRVFRGCDVKLNDSQINEIRYEITSI